MLVLCVLAALATPPRDALLNQGWKFHREAPAVWMPIGGQLLGSGEAKAVTSPQTFPLRGNAVRYLTLVIRSAHTSDFASLAEISFKARNGETVRPKLAGFSSQEKEGEDGRAENILDGKLESFWHSRWTGSGSTSPHALIFDFGAPTSLSSLTLWQRQRGSNAMVKRFDVYGSATKLDLPHNADSTVPERPYAGPGWQVVDVPHAARLEDDTLPEFHSFQGVVWYEKTISPHRAWAHKRVALEFDGAMQAADVWVNGEHWLRHTGGYLPFEVDLTPVVGEGKAATVDVRLDNRDDPTFPPGRPQSALDFTYAGGLYRDVHLEVTDPVHLHDVFVAPQHVTADDATLAIQATLAGPLTLDPVVIRTTIYDPAGHAGGQGQSLGGSGTARFHIHLAHPQRWDLDHPALYRAVTTLQQGANRDTLSTPFGIRVLDFNHKTGLTLNGRPIRLEGSNRHMGYPIVGNAASDEAQYREAKKLKGLGLNILRLAHYPQSPAFLDACDRVGILVIDPIPGWQFFQDTREFREHVIRDVRETIQRDRNHPCVAIFETSLNETYGVPDEFWRQCAATAHATFAGANFFTGGDGSGHHDTTRPLWDVPWTGWNDDSFTRPSMFPMQKGVDREYGDYEFGGEQSTSRAGRGDGEGALLLQAWNFIWSHNRNRGNSWSFGDLTWEAIDTYRGMNAAAPVSKSGMLDLFRLPKPVAYFYQSQGLSAPVVHIANNWTPRAARTKVVVFSNCDRVELRLNGKKIASQRPDHGPTTGYIGPKVADPLYWSKGAGQIVPATESEQVVGGKVGALPFSGGNARNLAHPPFTFMDVPYRPGRLEALGYRGGRLVAHDTVRTPGRPARLEISVDTEGVPLTADGSDFVFVYVKVVDRNGQVVPSAANSVTLAVQGPGRVLGAVRREAVAGIAAFMVQAGETPSWVTLRARGAGVAGTEVRIASRQR